jgi:hypothetical protein
MKPSISNVPRVILEGILVPMMSWLDVYQLRRTSRSLRIIPQPEFRTILYRRLRQSGVKNVERMMRQAGAAGLYLSGSYLYQVLTEEDFSGPNDAYSFKSETDIDLFRGTNSLFVQQYSRHCAQLMGNAFGDGVNALDCDYELDEYTTLEEYEEKRKKSAIGDIVRSGEYQNGPWKTLKTMGDVISHYSKKRRLVEFVHQKSTIRATDLQRGKERCSAVIKTAYGQKASAPRSVPSINIVFINNPSGSAASTHRIIETFDFDFIKVYARCSWNESKAKPVCLGGEHKAGPKTEQKTKRKLEPRTEQKTERKFESRAKQVSSEGEQKIEPMRVKIYDPDSIARKTSIFIPDEDIEKAARTVVISMLCRIYKYQSRGFSIQIAPEELKKMVTKYCDRTGLPPEMSEGELLAYRALVTLEAPIPTEDTVRIVKYLDTAKWSISNDTQISATDGFIEHTTGASILD